MKYKIKYVPSADRDLVAIYTFLEEYPQKRLRIFSKLDIALARLASMPKMFPIYDADPQFRRIVIEDYLVFYKLVESEELIEIHRILYAKMDIQKQFSPPTP